MKLSVGQKMSLLVGCALLGISVLTGLSQALMEKVYDSANYANANSLPSVTVLDELRKNFLRARLHVSHHVLYMDEAKMTESEVQLNLHRQGVLESIKRYEKNGCNGKTCISDENDRSYLNDARRNWDQLDTELAAILQESKLGHKDKARDMLLASQALAEKVAAVINAQMDLNAELAQKSALEATATRDHALRLSLLIAALTLVAIGLMGYVVTRTFMRQLGGEPEAVADIASQIAQGNLALNVEVAAGDHISLMARMKVMVDTMQRLATRAVAIGQGDLGCDVVLLSEHDQLGKAINDMSHQLRASQAADGQRNWLREGGSQLSQALSGNFSRQQLAEIAIGTLGRYLDAGRGVVYTYQAEEQVLELLGSYMYTERAQLGNRFREGEGAVGQVAREKKPIVLTTVAADAAPIVTGTSSAVPLYTYTYPLLWEGSLQGVLELASVERFEALKLELLNAVTPMIASFLFLAAQRDNIQKLLTIAERAEAEARLQSEHLQQSNALMEEQQQQLQQQSEELQQSNAQMEEQQQQLQQQTEELQQSNAQMEEQRQQLEQNNEELRQSRTEVEAKARQLEMSSQYKSEFLANMSHELRTPLNAIILLSKMMAGNQDGHLDPEDIKRADVIHRAGKDLLLLINDVLDLSKVEAGRMELNLVEVASASLGSDFLDLFEATAAQRGLAFVVEDRIQGLFVTDPDKLGQILRNLLSNAFKFTKAGQVTLRLERQPGLPLPIRIGVRDTGVGIAPDKQGLIFEAFRQVDGSTAREYGGTGLGLTISLRLAQLLGGTIELHSVPGAGSEFFLCLPEAAPVAVVTASIQPAVKAAPAPLDDRLRLTGSESVILLIDDDAALGGAVVEINRRQGYKTLLARSAAEGLALARQYHPAGILLDLGLPDMDGVQVLHELKSSQELMAIPVYVISARDRDQALALQGIVGYLQKPVDDQQIAQAEALLLSTTVLAQGEDVLVLASGGLDAVAVSRLFAPRTKAAPASVQEVAAGEPLQAALARQRWQLVIIDLTGLSLDAALAAAQCCREAQAEVALLFFGSQPISDEDEARLHRYTDSIIVKAPRAEQRLLEDMTRFLQRMPQRPRSNHLVSEVRDKNLHGKTILVVDDDPRNLFVITAALEQNGGHVLNAVNGHRALELLAKGGVDLLITDIMMPEMDGYQTIAAVRSSPALAELPIIALTAKVMPQDREKALAVGANDFLTKPVDYDVLLSMVSLWCSMKA